MDPDAFQQLYARHTPMLYSIAVRLSGNTADAEDFVHDTWLRAVTGLRAYRGGSSLRTWLVGVLINRTRESFRARTFASLDQNEALQALSQDQPPTADAMDIEAALARMPVRYREVFVLHDVEGFKHAEIADLLGIEEGTSRSQLLRGRGWLRNALGES
jgi:RNA polymerase sigma-70 factor (ECF subfamily)